MRIDVLSIFPDYLAPLELSLPGKAKAKGLLDLHVHDLRQWATDKHHKTDDTPYGGGAGMVMKPEPFGEAFDALGVDETTTVIFTTPSGEPFTQRLAEELATRERIVFACGRYEGIDQRVIDHARERAEVREISLGDYVLNGGEVAALAITEAVVRLIPGFMGNPDSLVEESHEDGLLEYPVYTKPKEWRGHEVPDVLLSGDHGKVAAWRHDQRVRRTAERRPDLLHRAGTGEWEIGPATPADAGELLTLTRACAVQEAVGAGTLALPPLQETVDDVRAVITGDEWQVWVARAGGRLVGSVRGRLVESLWEVARFMVAPDLQGRGLGRLLLEHAERSAAPEATAYVLGVLEGSEGNLRRYKRAGYRVMGAATVTDGVALVPLAKRRP